MITFKADCPKTVQQVIDSDTPSFALVIASEGNDKLAVAMLVKMINEVIKHFNIGKTMDDAQVMNTSRFILGEYSMLKLDHFAWCFDRAKKGKYGIVYDRIDGHVIFEWIEKFLHEFYEEAERDRINEKKKLAKAEKESDKAVPMPDKVKELLQSLKAKEPLKPAERLLNQSEQQRQINKWMYEFDELWMKQGADSGKRFVIQNIGLTEKEKAEEVDRINILFDKRTMNGEGNLAAQRTTQLALVGFKKMDISEYLEYRFKINAA